MNAIEQIDKKKNVIIFFLAFVLCGAFIDHLRVFGYYLFELSLVLAFLSCAAYYLISKRIVLLKHYILIPFLLLIVWSLVETKMFDGMKYLPKYFIFALLQIFVFINIVINFMDGDHYENFIKYTCWVFIGLAFILTGYYFSRGVFINFNEFGQSYSKYLLGFGALCCYYLMLTKRKIVYTILTYILVILSMLSLVRKMWLALFIAVVIISILYLFIGKKSLSKKEYRKSIIMIFSLLFAIVIICVLFLLIPRFSDAAVESMGSVNLTEISEGDDKRRLLNIAVIDQIMKSPIIGHGWGDRVYIEQYDFNSLYHNCYLSVWAQLGLIGLVLYCGIFLYALIKSIKIMIKKQYFDYGLFILAIWIFAAIVLYFRPLNRMSYYLWGPPLIFTLIFEAWEANKIIHIGKKSKYSKS